MILNRDLYYSTALRNDECFLVTGAPVRREESVLIQVDLDAPAVVLECYRAAYPDQPYSDLDIREGKFPDRWLLSGGALVMDQEGRIALGLRDGNAAAPFTYTNIAAGRCDGPLMEHCLEEIASECLLFVRGSATGWRQVDMGPATPAVPEIRLPCMAAWLQKSLVDDGSRVRLGRCAPKLLKGGVDYLALFFEVCDKGACVEREVVEGYVFIDHQENTTEFRIARAFDLSPYAQGDVMLVFGEGTGHGVWKGPEQIRALCRLQEQWGTPLVTPFLQRLVGV
ncbi:MAG TPA: hypothetical protein EYH03_06375 [Chromatiales bacterium]|nr:hypothetical protein [Chromatiales bacterium]